MLGHVEVMLRYSIQKGDYKENILTIFLSWTMLCLLQFSIPPLFLMSFLVASSSVQKQREYVSKCQVSSFDYRICSRIRTTTNWSSPLVHKPTLLLNFQFSIFREMCTDLVFGTCVCISNSGVLQSKGKSYTTEYRVKRNCVNVSLPNITIYRTSHMVVYTIYI